MELDLEDLVVVLTGASGGIGRAIAAAFAEEGARVACFTLTQEDALREWIGSQPWSDRAQVFRADVGSPVEIELAVAEAGGLWGRVDVAVPCAGIWPEEERRLDQLEEARLRDVVEVNLLGALFTARAFLRALAATGPREDGRGASIVFIGSTAGRFGESGHVDYAAAKSALRGVTLSLKNEIVELDPAGRVNLVEPGWTVTPMTREKLDEPGVAERVTRTAALSRIAEAEDIARSVVWLASPTAARHVTGEILTVAGGMEGRVLRE
jgi:3-oxoacyl-[acyl-carrier protein] reductase